MLNPKTPKLNDLQLVLLSSACQRDDGLAVLPENVAAAAVKKAVLKLIGLALFKEVRGKPNQPLWWTDEDGKTVGLKITKAGAAAIGVADDGPKDEEPRPEPKRRAKNGGRNGAATKGEAGEPRRDSKRAQVIALMQRKTGATLDEMVKVTGWLPHTTRAALTGLRDKDYVITKSKNGEGKTVYRIESADDQSRGSGSKSRKAQA